MHNSTHKSSLGLTIHVKYGNAAWPTSPSRVVGIYTHRRIHIMQIQHIYYQIYFTEWFNSKGFSVAVFKKKKNETLNKTRYCKWPHYIYSMSVPHWGEGREYGSASPLWDIQYLYMLYHTCLFVSDFIIQTAVFCSWIFVFIPEVNRLNLESSFYIKLNSSMKCTLKKKHYIKGDKSRLR